MKDKCFVMCCLYSANEFDLEEVRILLSDKPVEHIPHNPGSGRPLKKKAFENIVKKGENAGNDHLPFSHTVF